MIKLLRLTLLSVLLVSSMSPSNAEAQTSPAPYTTAYRYDVAQRLTGVIRPDPDGSGPATHLAERRTYDARGVLTTIENGELAGWQSEAIPPASWSTFTVFQTTSLTYDNWGRKLRATVSSQGVAQNVTQFSYDSIGRLECTARRMNPSAFGGLPASGCTLSSPGSFGSDRITKYFYDSQNRIVKIQKAVGTPIQQDYARFTYTANGNRATVTDANGNVSNMVYDGFGRLSYWYFPSKTTTGQYNSSDYEQYQYDQNGNLTFERKRTGQTITLVYDAVNQVVTKNVPGSVDDVYYGYNLRGLQLYARFGSPSGDGIIDTFDGFGRHKTSTTTMGGHTRTLTYEYDSNGNRTKLTHPDGIHFDYIYDGLDRVVEIVEDGTVPLVALGYDNQGRRNILVHSGGATTSYGYDSISRLQSIGHDLVGIADDVIYSLHYNPANQVVSMVTSNDDYVFAGHSNGNVSYTPNGLNQIGAVNGLAFTYDANGNLTSDESVTYTYDLENRLLTGSGSAQATLTYDPAGRLFETVSGSITNRFLYDGNSLVAEFNSGGQLQKRYVHGPGIDKPLIEYEGSSVSNSTRRFLYANHQGSIVGVGNSSGSLANINTYDAYGIPEATNVGRFAYTGQIMIPELNLYYYKARMYSPFLGRFMQTDPVGYDDQINLYAYVQNDPLNNLDYSGLETITLMADLDLYAFAGGGISLGFYYNSGKEAGERLDFGLVGSLSFGLGYDASIGGTYAKVFGDASLLNGLTDFTELSVGLISGRYSESQRPDCCIPELQAVEVGVEYSVSGPVGVASGKELTRKLGYGDAVKLFNGLSSRLQRKVIANLNEMFKGGLEEAERAKALENCNRGLQPAQYCGG